MNLAKFNPAGYSCSIDDDEEGDGGGLWKSTVGTTFSGTFSTGSVDD